MNKTFFFNAVLIMNGFLEAKTFPVNIFKQQNRKLLKTNNNKKVSSFSSIGVCSTIVLNFI